MKRNDGFSLIEMMVVLGIFGLVLTMAYQILISTLVAEQQINELTRSGKIGQSIMTLIRRDLENVAYHELGQAIFRGVNRGEGESGEDSVHFLTYAPVPDPPDAGAFDDWQGEVASVGYVLKQGGGTEGSVLFRRVYWNLQEEDHLESGNYFPIYARVKGISFRYFDGVEWLDEWESSDRFPPPTDDELLDGEEPPAETAGTDDLDEDEEDVVLPLPIAVEVELHVFLGDEDGLYKDDKGEPVVERYYMVVPLLAMDRLALQLDDTEDEDL